MKARQPSTTQHNINRRAIKLITPLSDRHDVRSLSLGLCFRADPHTSGTNNRLFTLGQFEKS
ncbi:MAG TPA: hypothetical protein VGD58_33945 [Herpetosiphonaceae bacterium]